MARLALEKAIKKKKLSKRQLSVRLGVRYNHVFRYFKPEYNPRFSKLGEFAKAIGCGVRDLIED